MKHNQAPPPAQPVPRNAKQARELLRDLRQRGEELVQRLRELEVHPAYRRLRTTHSTGPTLRAWDRASAIADALAARLRDFHELLDRVEGMLGSGRFGRQDLAVVVTLLTGPAEPAGPGDPRAAAVLIEAMDASCTEALAIVLDVEERFTQMGQQLHRLRERLGQLRIRADTLAFRDQTTRRTVDALEGELDEVTPAALADPMGAVGTTVDESGSATADRLRRLTAGIEDAEADLSALSRQQAELQTTMAELRSALADAEAADRAARATETQIQERIAGFTMPDGLDGTALRARLQRVDQQRAEGRWRPLNDAVRELRAQLDAARQQAAGRHEAALALLEQRDELRGRLNAYRAMAVRLRHAEDLDLADEYERTYRILWTAPCDLAVAAEAVERYQRAVIRRTDPDDRVQDSGGE